MDRVFYTNDGRLYKDEQPVDPSHGEMIFPTRDVLKALTKAPMTREQMLTKINHVNFDKEEEVKPDDPQVNL